MMPKFRAWDKDDKVMRIVNEIHFGTGSITCMPLKDHDDMLEMYDPICFEGHYELMQSTGQKDKNGVELFEGDICKCFNGLKDYWYVVEWVYAGWQTVTFKKPDSSVVGIAHEMNQFYIEPDEAKQLTIVGNIYQNPDLIKVS